MQSLANYCYSIFRRSIDDYHVSDDVDAVLKNPFVTGTIEELLYHKNWIDGVQWHLEDLVRDPDIDNAKGMSIKRRIDRLNQQRTDIVELLDDHFNQQYSPGNPLADARLNTESPGWAIDRLSILALKEYHVEAELGRTNVDRKHVQKCIVRRETLGLQQKFLIESIDQLIHDIVAGKAIVKIYKQMKMYNDQEFNPVLYNKVSLADAKP